MKLPELDIISINTFGKLKSMREDLKKFRLDMGRAFSNIRMG
jgi:hypothetical protein